MGLIVQYSRYLFFTASIFLILINRNTVRSLIKNTKFYLTIALILVLFISASINKTDVAAVFQLALYMLYPFLLFASWSWRIAQTEDVCRGLTYGLNILVLLNLLIMILMPQGLFQTISSDTVSRYYLFGAKNQMVAPVMTCLFFNIEFAYRRYKKVTKSALFMFFICAIELYIGGSGTGLIVLFAFIILVILQLKNRNANSNMALVVLIISFASIVIFRVQNIFSFIIVGVLHKSLTLSDRTYIWDTAFESIRKNPIIGTGITESLSGNVHLKLNYLTKDIFAHDIYLDYLLMGGIPALCIFIVLIISVKRSYEKLINVRYQTFIWWGVVIYLFASIVEIYTTNYCLFLMFAYMGILEQSIRKNHLVRG
ncbi:O-antigen ligase family protein [Bifidobacterium sp. MA2]|uniref:O-antigen ligase family protein n=1 Tax=Bifidobacterium santillanense TaxID=2809028 RepID=A0ABS5UQM9_9BIFI|nr:O-antigen ligase family protein [Bifidobacterium santillanense]MBT1173171.1 O-antigen ligase family protein [Bifidobacterium santillanense]